MDWGLKHKLGNLFTTHFNNLNRNYIIELSKQPKSDIICRKCELFRNRFNIETGGIQIL
jgi:hypothetical protein